jgi:hypothetical protein
MGSPTVERKAMAIGGDRGHLTFVLKSRFAHPDPADRERSVPGSFGASDAQLPVGEPPISRRQRQEYHRPPVRLPVASTEPEREAGEGDQDETADEAQAREGAEVAVFEGRD